MIKRTTESLPGVGILLGAAVLLSLVPSFSGEAGAAGQPAPNHWVAMTSPVSNKRLLLTQVAELSSQAQDVADAVEIWGCEETAANSPGVDAQLGPEVAAHALTTCRPVPPTDSSFPTSVANPGPAEFGTEIGFFQGFAQGRLAGRWSSAATQITSHLRLAASGLATLLGTGGNDNVWSSEVRGYLINLDTLIPQIERVLKSGH